MRKILIAVLLAATTVTLPAAQVSQSGSTEPQPAQNADSTASSKHHSRHHQKRSRNSHHRTSRHHSSKQHNQTQQP